MILCEVKMKKHAYLIIAHNNFVILKKLIVMLDNSLNDIFIHIDKKSGSFNEKEFNGIVKKSHLHFIDRKNVFWADYSQVDVALDLIECALNTDIYQYFHIISGVCLPIKTQEYIHKELENSDKILMAIVPRKLKYCDDSIQFYYKFLDKPYYRKCKPLKFFNRLYIECQRLFGIDRLRNKNFTIYNGWDWLSFPYDFAKYLVDSRKEIYDTFHQTLNPIEMVYQTWACKSDIFRNRIKDLNNFQNSSMRLIDWNRGRPYTFRKEDFDQIMSSDCFFARKFDEKVDFEIVEMIYNEIMQKQQVEIKELLSKEE